MKTLLNIVISVLLLINGAGAIVGGSQLITHPDGSSLKMPLEFLQHSPFHDYFIPGIILFTANGIFSFIVLAILLFRGKHYSWYVATEGAILTGWILIQMILLQTFNSLQFVFGTMGVLLIGAGWRLNKMNTEKNI